MSRSLRALLAAALIACAVPSAAHADGFVGIGAGGDLFYSDTSPASNDLLVQIVGNEISIQDRSARIAAAAPCRVFNLTEAVCPASAPSVIINTFFGSDKVEYRLPHGGFVDLGDGADSLFAGVRQGGTGRAIEPVTYRGGAAADTITYFKANRGVFADISDHEANDGRPGDRENVLPDFETIVGSHFGDQLFATPNADAMIGNGGDDFLAAGHGNDLFVASPGDGADDFHGSAGTDTIDYGGNSQPVVVSLDNVADDGARDEGDNVRSNIENVLGGSAGDVLESFGAASRLDGRGGDDFLFGNGGGDTLIGGAGVDNLNASTGNDVVDSRDGQLDTIDCGPDADSLIRDSQERRIAKCESATVGVLRLGRRAIRAEAGQVARVKLAWRHPRAWRELSRVELRVVRGGRPVGEVTIRPRRERLVAKGAVRLVRKGSRLSHRGRTVAARLALRLDERLAGQRLTIEIEATDSRGRRQLERAAGAIEVA